MGGIYTDKKALGTKLSTDAAEAAIRNILGAAVLSVSANGNAVFVYEYVVYLKRLEDVSFAQLEQLSCLFTTKNINFGKDEGWGGSDVTGPDPDEYWLRIAKDVQK